MLVLQVEEMLGDSGEVQRYRFA